MCGILACFGDVQDSETGFSMRLRTMQRRGPDELNIVSGENYIIGHTRNCIMNPKGGQQPIENSGWIVAHNGEIYNGTERKPDQSDSHYIVDLLKSHGAIDTPVKLDGVFGFVAYNQESKMYYVARDSVGVIPLYRGKQQTQYGWLEWFSSELKALEGMEVTIVKPGYLYTYGSKMKWSNGYKMGHVKANTYEVRKLLNRAVQKRLKCDVPFGILLSGGLDSSIISSIIKWADLKDMAFPVLHTFSIGLEDSPDLEYAELMSEHIGATHHEIRFTVDEGLSILDEVIYAIETYDVTTIRASVPMYLLGKYMKKVGIKMVFSGEGSDELMAGYLYNRYCPSKEEMHDECVRKMNNLHYHDCLRANKSLAAHGIECRVPFLDKYFVNYCMNMLDPTEKMSKTHPHEEKQEKWLLRDAFKLQLPHQITNREKVQFSDGVGNEWIDGLKEYADKCITDDQMSKAERTYPFQTPTTKEAYLYRQIFTKKFKHEADATVLYIPSSIACSSDKAFEWHKFSVKDPSAQSLHTINKK